MSAMRDKLPIFVAYTKNLQLTVGLCLTTGKNYVTDTDVSVP